MKLRLALSVLAPTALLFAACGGTDFTGVYQQTSSTLDVGGCGMGVATSTPSHVMVQQSSLLGQTVLKISFCTSADPTSCAGSAGSLATQGLLTGDGTGGVSSGIPDGTGCAIIDVYTVLTKTGDELTIDTKRSEGTVAGACEASKLSSHRSELSCKSASKIVGKKVAEAPAGKDNTLSF